MKKNPFSLQLDLDSFIPATDAEKEYMVKMRPSSTFFKDGVKRLLKNPVATIAFILIVIITLSCIIIPMFWPYSYDQMLGVIPRKPVDPSYNNLAPFTYGTSEGLMLLGQAQNMLFDMDAYSQQYTRMQSAISNLEYVLNRRAPT